MTNAAATTLANAIRTQTGLGVRVWEKGDHCRVYVTCPNLNANAHGENGRSLYLDMTKPMLPRKDDSGFWGRIDARSAHGCNQNMARRARPPPPRPTRAGPPAHGRARRAGPQAKQ